MAHFDGPQCQDVHQRSPALGSILTLVANSRLLATIPKIRRPPHEEFGPDSASCEFATTVNSGVKSIGHSTFDCARVGSLGVKNGHGISVDQSRPLSSLHRPVDVKPGVKVLRAIQRQGAKECGTSHPGKRIDALIPFLSHWDRDQENWAFADRERSKQARSMNPVLNST